MYLLLVVLELHANFLLAVQHERAPRSSQPSLHHYPLNMTARLRGLHGSSFFSTIPFHLQTPLSVTDHAGTLHAPYIPQSVLYPGIVGNFTKSNLIGGTIGEGELAFCSTLFLRL